MQCYRCGNNGHLARDCEQSLPSNQAPQSHYNSSRQYVDYQPQSRPSARSVVLSAQCMFCGSSTHDLRDCPEKGWCFLSNTMCIDMVTCSHLINRLLCNKQRVVNANVDQQKKPNGLTSATTTREVASATALTATAEARSLTTTTTGAATAAAMATTTMRTDFPSRKAGACRCSRSNLTRHKLFEF